MAKDLFMVLERSMVKPLEEALDKAAGNHTNANHATFHFYDNNGEEVYVTFSDFKAFFGKSVGPF